MAVRLQTAKGEIKEYKTARGMGLRPAGGDSLEYKKWVTKCGMEWENKPKLQEECHHLDCAIKVAISDIKSGLVWFMAFIMLLFVVVFGNRIGEDPFFFDFFLIGFFVIMASAILISTLGSWKKSIELTEYRGRGTIKGIRAWQIFEDQEVAKAKRWRMFWG